MRTRILPQFQSPWVVGGYISARRPSLRYRAQYAAFDAKGRTVGGGGLLRGDVDHHVRNLLSSRETLDERARPEVLYEVLSHRIRPRVVVARHSPEEGFDTIGQRR